VVVVVGARVDVGVGVGVGVGVCCCGAPVDGTRGDGGTELRSGAIIAASHSVRIRLVGWLFKER
jgi:hypothetical protein